MSSSKTALLLEDGEGNRKYMAEQLVEKGYKVIEAGTSSEANNLLETRGAEISVVVSDISVPYAEGEIDDSNCGKEFVIKALQADKPVIVASSESNLEEELGKELQSAGLPSVMTLMENGRLVINEHQKEWLGDCIDVIEGNGAMAARESSRASEAEREPHTPG